MGVREEEEEEGEEEGEGQKTIREGGIPGEEERQGAPPP